MKLRILNLIVCCIMLSCSVCLGDNSTSEKKEYIIYNNPTPSSTELEQLSKEAQNVSEVKKSDVEKEEDSKKDEVKTDSDSSKSDVAKDDNSKKDEESSSSNAFSNDNIKVSGKSDEKTETTVKTEILDKVIAEAAGIASITEGFPKDGTVSVDGSSGVRLRSWPWGDVINKYYNGTELKVLGVSGEFYLVDINGKQGYMHKNYVSTEGAPASKKEPYYPGNTKSGGSLALEEGIQASKDGAEGKVPTVNPNDDNNGNTDGKKGGTTTGANGKVVMNIPQLCQGNTKTPHPWSACGPTSLSMVLAYYTGKDAGEMASKLWYTCGSTGESGTTHAGMVKGAKAYGYPNAKWSYNVTQSWVREQIKAGKPLIANVNHHYVVIKGIDDNGTVYINDPGKRVVDRSMSWSEFRSWWSPRNYAAMVLE